MEIEKVFKRLLIKEPFYGLFCLGLPKKITDKVPTLAVTKNGINCELSINKEFFDSLSDDEQIAVIKHELSHICLQHMFMSKSFSDPKLFNISADIEVNSYIENLPENGCKASDFHLIEGQGTKYYYEALKNRQQPQSQSGSPQKPCNGGMGGNSPSSSSSSVASGQQDVEQEQQKKNDKGDMSDQYPDNIISDKTPIDDHSTWKAFENLSEPVKQLITNNVNSMVMTTADQVIRQRGTIPANLIEIIEKLKEKKPEIFNWKGYFRRLLGSIYDVNIRSTRRKESKRFEGSSGIQHKKKVSILVAIDTSSSVRSNELQDFFNEIDYIYKAGAKVTIIECDTNINSITEYDGRRIPKIKGRGGTNFNPPVDYYLKHKKEYATLVYFTDGYSTLPDKRPSGIVWVITSDGERQDYPGKTIYIPKED